MLSGDEVNNIPPACDRLARSKGIFGFRSSRHCFYVAFHVGFLLLAPQPRTMTKTRRIYEALVTGAVPITQLDEGYCHPDWTDDYVLGWICGNN